MRTTDKDAKESSLNEALEQYHTDLIKKQMEQPKQRVLIVENDEDTLFLLKRALTNASYIVEACTAGSGIVEFKHPVPDLFILDQGLPTIDGIALTKFLRLQESTKRIPIIMISGQLIEKKAKLAGIDQFIQKPFDISYLLMVVDEHIQNSAQEIER